MSSGTSRLRYYRDAMERIGVEPESGAPLVRLDDALLAAPGA